MLFREEIARLTTHQKVLSSDETFFKTVSILFVSPYRIVLFRYKIHGVERDKRLKCLYICD